MLFSLYPSAKQLYHAEALHVLEHPMTTTVLLSDKIHKAVCSETSEQVAPP
jgi:predicted short-subunit dehydrogenase-like oxidoreductase (DUF2520 family)